MANNLLKNGKIIYPNKLILKKNFNIGLIGSGKIAEEYARVISSFGHKIKVIISQSKNYNAKKLAKKYKSNIYSNIKQVQINEINAWIVCVEWSKLDIYINFFLKTKTPVLIEKGAPISSLKILNYINKYKKNSNLNFAYNRNFFDYIPYLLSILNKNKINYIEMKIYDLIDDIIKKKGRKITKYLKYYITSHWISLIYKLISLSNYKFSKIKKEKLTNYKKFNIEKISIILKKGTNKILLNIINFPNGLKNHTCKFYFKKFLIELSPFERILLYKSIKKKNFNNNFIYIPQIDKLEVSKKYKPGFRFMYYDFIKNIYSKEKFSFGIKLKDLYKIYRICEKFS